MRSVHLYRSYAMVIAIALVAAACSPMKAAQTIEQRAYVAEKSYNIVLEDALVIAKDPATTQSVRAAIQKASATAAPIIDQLDQAAANAAIERAKFNAGQTTVDKVELAANNLQGWITRAEQAMLDLSAAFKH